MVVLADHAKKEAVKGFLMLIHQEEVSGYDF